MKINELTTGTSIFTDDSGARKRAITWTIRGFTILLAFAAIAIGLSVVGGVPLPGLDSPLHIPGVGPSSTTADRSTHGTTDRAQPQVNNGTTPARSTSSTSGLTSSARTTGAANTPAAAQPTATPTPAATTKARGKPTAKPPTAANPSHAPGSPPTAPPGQSKKITSGE